MTASCRVIPCRWVTVDKGGDVTQSRIVIKDCKSQSGESARSLGISSPTPSSDALQLIIGLSGLWDLTLGGADVTNCSLHGNTTEEERCGSKAANVVDECSVGTFVSPLSQGS